jgi:hypothetical protein
VGRDFRFLGVFLQDGHKIAGQAHRDFRGCQAYPQQARNRPFSSTILGGYIAVPQAQGNPPQHESHVVHESAPALPDLPKAGISWQVCDIFVNRKILSKCSKNTKKADDKAHPLG